MTDYGKRTLHQFHTEVCRQAVIAIVCLLLGSAAIPAFAEVVDEPDLSISKVRKLTADELWEFSHPSTVREFDLLDLITKEEGMLSVGEGKIRASWYSEGEARVAVLNRTGLACIVIRREAQPTKCIAISEDPSSRSCQFVIREIHDERVACLRERDAP